MPVSLIVQVLVRLLSLLWVLQGSIALVGALAVFNAGWSFGDKFMAYYLGPVLTLVFAATSWFAAPRLSRLIVGRADETVAVSGLSLYDLYAFAFVFLGVYFALSSLADMLNWAHFFLLENARTTTFESLLTERHQPSYYEFSRPFITLVSATMCIVYRQRWAKKLCNSSTSG